MDELTPCSSGGSDLKRQKRCLEDEDNPNTLEPVMPILCEKSRQTHFLSAFMNRGLTSLSKYESLIDKMLIPKLKFKIGFQTPQGTQSSVFGLEFSLDGRILLSSHRDNSLRGFDNRTHAKIWTKHAAHDDSCNGCTFIDGSLFASYSDDKNVKMWDLRNMSRSVKTLTGHVGWVKNVCVVPGGKKLLTSGLDQTIRLYDINSPSEHLESSPLMTFDGLCRMKLAQSGDFLLLTTCRTNAYKILNLDLERLKDDLAEFIEAPRSKPFGKERNIIKFVHHVPGHREAYSGYSVDISNDEHCCVLRHTCPTSNLMGDTEQHCNEWVSVYDLTPQKENEPTDKAKNVPETEMDDHTEFLDDNNGSEEVEVDDSLPSLSPSPVYDTDSDDDLIYAPSTWPSVINRELELLHARNISVVVDNYLLENANETRLRLSMLFRAWHDSTRNVRPQDLHDAAYFHEFESSAPGIIKEASFSSTGRLIVSPTVSGFRILAFDSNLNSFSQSISNKSTFPMNATQLTTVKDCTVYANSACLCTKFSPVESMVAVGDEQGRVMWYSPLDRD